MNTLNELSQAEKKQRILVLCNENEIAGLQAQGLPVSCEDSLLSMQHLKMARLEAERRHKLNEGLQVFTITPEPVQATEAERALIYAMLVRCRKVISCRDKLEDMLKFDDREGWAAYKQEYENKVLDASTYTNDTSLIQILGSLFADVRDIGSQLLHTTLCLTYLKDVFVNVDRRKEVLTNHTLVQHDSILIVITLPRHVSHLHVTSQSKLAFLG